MSQTQKVEKKEGEEEENDEELDKEVADAVTEVGDKPKEPAPTKDEASKVSQAKSNAAPPAPAKVPPPSKPEPESKPPPAAAAAAAEGELPAKLTPWLKFLKILYIRSCIDVGRTSNYQFFMMIQSWLLSEPNDTSAERLRKRQGRNEEDESFMQKIAALEAGVTTDSEEQLSAHNPIGMKHHTKKLFKAILNIYVDPSKDFYYYWSAIVGFCCMYNIIMVVARTSFEDFNNFWQAWVILDYTSDLIYLLDMIVCSKKSFLEVEEGRMVVQPRLLFLHYKDTLGFKLDVLSVLPTEVLWLIRPQWWIVRLNRVLRSYRLSEWVDRTETRTSLPNLFRVLKLLVMIFVIFHWNACLFFVFSKLSAGGIDVRGGKVWQFQYDSIRNYMQPTCDVDECLYDDPVPESWDDLELMPLWPNGTVEREQMLYEHWVNRSQVLTFSNLTRQYMFSLYWSALILTTIGEQVVPTYNWQFLFQTVDILLGLLIFATIVGQVGEMVTNMNAAKATFEEQQDGVKQYMEHRKVNAKLQIRIIKWFRYIWGQGQSLDGEAVTENLPDKLKAEMAMQVHMDTLKRVKLFQDCEPGLLVELVLKLKLQVYSPGDYICRKGDVGKEMYIVKRGSLNVVAPDGIKVFVTLKEGTVFGELSIMDIPGNKNGNKRTAGVRSVGYSDLFVLSKDDLWDALREYPEAKKLLLQKGRELLAKDNMIDETAPDLETGPRKTVEQKYEHIERQIVYFTKNLDDLYTKFAEDTALSKQRITALEKTFDKDEKKLNKLLEKKRRENQQQNGV